MRICSFNVENLFERAKALNTETWAEGRPILEAHAEVNKLINEAVYTPAIKAAIVEHLTTLGLRKEDTPRNGQAMLRQVRGRLVKRTKVGTKTVLEVVAAGRDSWIGWVDLAKEPVNALATQHTAMVMKEIDADVLGVVEADNRIALKAFSDLMLAKVGGTPYGHVMLIDGNDLRGIDVGLLTKPAYEIAGIRSHVDEPDGNGRLFSRDCPEFTIVTPKGNRVVVLVNHLKSKGYGNATESAELRTRQATAVAAIYKRLRADGAKNVAVLGDFNDFPGSPPLEPLVGQTDLKDVSQSNKFQDPLPGTFGRSSNIKSKFDYILLSPNLFQRVSEARVFRKGVWGENKNPPKKWEIYPTLTRPIEAASDHAAIYADIDI